MVDKLILLFVQFLIVGLTLAHPVDVENAVINGSPPEQTIPHAVLVIAHRETGTFLGAGSIITPRHIVTIASHIYGSTLVTVGYGSNTFADLTLVETDNYVIRRDFNITTLENDIAIIVLGFADAIVFSENVKPIGLPTVSPPAAALAGQLAGFGFTGPNQNAPSQSILVASLTVTAIADCTAHFNVEELPTHFCAIGETSVGGTTSNTCAGDHGAGFYTGEAWTEPEEEEEEGEDGGEGGEDGGEGGEDGGEGGEDGGEGGEDGGEGGEDGGEGGEDGGEGGEGGGEGGEDGGEGGEDGGEGGEDGGDGGEGGGDEGGEGGEDEGLGGEEPPPEDSPIVRQTKRNGVRTVKRKPAKNRAFEPTAVLVGLLSMVGSRWVCNPTEPRAYVDVAQYIQWIQETANIDPTVV